MRSPWACPAHRRAGGLADLTLTLTYNDPDGVRAAFAEYGDRIACVIVEPVAGNMNCIRRRRLFGNAAEVCTDSGAVLILDEVMTGFASAWPAPGFYGIEADLTWAKSSAVACRWAPSAASGR